MFLNECDSTQSSPHTLCFLFSDRVVYGAAPFLHPEDCLEMPPSSLSSFFFFVPYSLPCQASQVSSFCWKVLGEVFSLHPLLLVSSRIYVKASFPFSFSLQSVVLIPFPSSIKPFFPPHDPSSRTFSNALFCVPVLFHFEIQVPRQPRLPPPARPGFFQAFFSSC